MIRVGRPLSNLGSLASKRNAIAQDGMSSLATRACLALRTTLSLWFMDPNH